MSTTATTSPQIGEGWKEALLEEFHKPYFQDLKNFLTEEKQQFPVYPPGPLIFNAFNNTPFENVKVVILGQDPYHGPGQANGLCFSIASSFVHAFSAAPESPASAAALPEEYSVSGMSGCRRLERSSSARASRAFPCCKSALPKR